MEHVQTPVTADKPDEIIESYYGWRWNESTHKIIYRSFGSIAAVSFGVAFLAL
jgi:hypothetical protein